MPGKYSQNHPTTSRLAAESLDDETLGQMQRDVLAAIRSLGDATMDEVAAHLDRFPYRQSVSARLNELHHDQGRIEVVGHRKGVAGRLQQVYAEVKR